MSTTRRQVIGSAAAAAAATAPLGRKRARAQSRCETIRIGVLNDDGKAVVERMKKMPTDDPCFGKQHVREDGLFITPVYLFKVKTPAESKQPWDYYKVLITTPADEAWIPIREEGCPLVQA